MNSIDVLLISPPFWLNLDMPNMALPVLGAELAKHNLKIKFADSGVAETKFAVVSLNNTKITSNPQTGDNIFVYGTIMTISIIGIISTYVINRKKFNNK